LAECAFVTSHLPVILSLEMHCTPGMQRQLMKMLVSHLGKRLLTYEAFIASGTAASSSPDQLNSCVLVKGKAKTRSESAKSESDRSPTRSSLCRSPTRASLRALVPSLSRSSSNDGSNNVSSFTSPPSTPKPRRQTFRKSCRKSNDFRKGLPIRGVLQDNQDLEEESMTNARRTLAMKHTSSLNKIDTDPFYTKYLSLRSLPVALFLSDGKPTWALPISSINEDKLLMELGLSSFERNQIENLSSNAPTRRLTGVHLSMSAVDHLAAHPPSKVGVMQRRTCSWILRPFPLGLRFSGANMSPVPGWLAGAQCVALNMSNNDLPLQLHYALFKGSRGFVLKPSEMTSQGKATDVEPGQSCTHEDVKPTTESELQDVDGYWPPPRKQLQCVTINLFSLHNLPTHGERRPKFDGRHEACHNFAPQLSGSPARPTNEPTTSPLDVTISLHPIGGLCAICKVLPPPENSETTVTVTATGNGLNAVINTEVQCLAAEPHATILRVSAMDSEAGQVLAYETAVLGRLRRGYRILQMRSPLGTRIQLCYLLVRIGISKEPNFWATAAQMLRMVTREQMDELKQKLMRITTLEELAALQDEV